MEGSPKLEEQVAQASLSLVFVASVVLPQLMPPAS